MKIIVFSGEQYENFPPENLLKFSEWVMDRINEIPKEHRESAKIEIRATSYYDSTYVTIQITYEREDTDQERRERLQQEQAAAESRKRIELSQLNWLRQKYGV